MPNGRPNGDHKVIRNKLPSHSMARHELAVIHGVTDGCSHLIVSKVTQLEAKGESFQTQPSQSSQQKVFRVEEVTENYDCYLSHSK